MSSQVATYINRSILINSLPKDSAATRVLSSSSDEEVLSFYSNTYESVDVAHFLLTERKERLFGLINLIRDGEYFLDVGCANGAHMDELYKRGIYGVGLDISVPNILRGLEQRPHLKFIHGFAENIPFGDAHFDAAIIGDVLEHFRDAKLALAEILRVTKTGFAACFPNSSEKTIEHINPVTVSSFIELCAFFALKVAFFDKDGQILQEADESFLWCFARAQKTARTDMIVQSVMSEHKKHLEDKARVLDIDQWKWGETHQRHQTETDRFNLTSIAIKGNKILEVACGNGDLSVFLAKLGFRVTGIDISNTGIHQAKSHAEKENVVDRTRFLVMDATKLDFPDNTFDCVIFPEVMEHVTSSRQYISEAIRVLKPGGRIVVSVPDTLEVPWPGHIRLFTKETLATEIEQYADDIIWYEMSFKKWLLCAFTPNVKQGSEVVDDLPVVNILMPTYNRSHLIRRAIDSIVQQTYANWKLLVINDGGEDVSDIVRSFRDERIHYHCFGHAGKAAALNRGLELIDVGYITYLDDDDIVFPNHLEVLVRAARLNNKAFIFSDTYLTIVDENSGNVLNQYIENTADVDFFSLKFSNQINHKQILHTKGLSDMVGLYDESLNILIDYDYIKRLALAEPPYHVKLITGNYFRYHRDGKITTISGLWDSNPKECGESLVNIFKKHPLDMCELYRGFHYQHGIAAERDGQIASLTQAVAEREGQIGGLKELVAERGGQVASLTQAVAERDGQVASLTQAVAEREGQIGGLKELVAERDGQVASLTQAVAEREGQIGGLKELVAELEGEIASLNFIARRIKAPLRLGRRFIGSILHPLSAYRLSRDMRIIKGSNVFDIDYYLSRYRDVRISTCNPIRHYCEFGWKERRNPSPLFDTNYYLAANPDIAAVGINPFAHYIKYGKMEGRVSLSKEISSSSSEYDGHTPSLKEAMKGFGLVRVKLAKTSKYYRQYGMRQTVKKITSRIQEAGNQSIVAGNDYPIPFIYPLNIKVSSEAGRRLNLLVPSLEKQHLYGGIATAISLFGEMAKHFPKARVIVTDSPGGDYDRESFEKYDLVFINDRYAKWLDVGAGDVFVASAWWTAYILQPVLTWQQREYGLRNPHYFYLIQDYEPGFYPWSTSFALAESTYHSEHPTIAVFNTNILRHYFDSLGYQFYKAFSFHPPINQSLLEGVEKSRCAKRPRPYRIIVYGRPSVERNCFNLTVQSLRNWCRDFTNSRQWSVISAGESHPVIQLSEGIYLRSVGKLSLSDYQDLLIRSSVGISFMISPHPSYPPLEMADYGLEVVTNSFANKDLSRLTDNITSIRVLTPENVAQAVNEVCTKVELRGGMPAIVASGILETESDFGRLIKQLEPYF